MPTDLVRRYLADRDPLIRADPNDDGALEASIYELVTSERRPEHSQLRRRPRARRVVIAAAPVILAIAAFAVASSLGGPRTGIARAAVIGARASAALARPGTIIQVHATVYGSQISIASEIPYRWIGPNESEGSSSGQGLNTDPEQNPVSYTYRQWKSSNGRVHTIYDTGDETAAGGDTDSTYDPANNTLTTVTGEHPTTSASPEILRPRTLPDPASDLTLAQLKGIYREAQEGNQAVQIIGKTTIEGHPTYELRIIPAVPSPSNPDTGEECTRAGGCHTFKCTSIACARPTPFSMLLYIDTQTYLPVRAVMLTMKTIPTTYEASLKLTTSLGTALPAGTTASEITDFTAETLPETPENESLLQIDSHPGETDVELTEAELAKDKRTAGPPSHAVQPQHEATTTTE